MMVFKSTWLKNTLALVLHWKCSDEFLKFMNFPAQGYPKSMTNYVKWAKHNLTQTDSTC